MTDLANGFSTKILQKCNFYMETKKNNFVNLGDTDKKCRYPAVEGITRTYCVSLYEFIISFT